MDSTDLDTDAKHRSICKKFYVTAEEDQQIQQLCQGVNQSRYFRSCVLNRAVPRPKAIVPQDNREAIVHLAAIRSSLKKIARTMSSTMTSADLERLRQLEEVILDVQRQLKQSGEVGHDWEDFEK